MCTSCSWSRHPWVTAKIRNTPSTAGIPWPALRGPLRNHFWKKEASPAVLAQRARRGILMPRGKNCRETILAAQLPRNCPLRGGKFERWKCPLLWGRGNFGGILRDNLGKGNWESKIAARQWGVNFCREASRCLVGPSGGGREFWNALEASNALNYRVWGIQPYSRGEFQGTLWERFRVLSGIFLEFLPKSPSRAGGVAQKALIARSGVFCQWGWLSTDWQSQTYQLLSM